MKNDSISNLNIQNGSLNPYDFLNNFNLLNNKHFDLNIFPDLANKMKNYYFEGNGINQTNYNLELMQNYKMQNPFNTNLNSLNPLNLLNNLSNINQISQIMNGKITQELLDILIKNNITSNTNSNSSPKETENLNSI